MKQYSLPFLLSFFLIAFTSFIPAQDDEPLKDYLKIPGPIQFNQTGFQLVWTTRTGHNYYRQQYLPPLQSMKNYDRFVMIEVVKGKNTQREQIAIQTKQIRERKLYDELAKYELFEKLKPDEFVLEFSSSETIRGETTYMEWNIYRYINLKNVINKSGVMIIGYHTHASGKYIDGFNSTIQRERMNLINQLMALEVPKVSL